MQGCGIKTKTVFFLRGKLLPCALFCGGKFAQGARGRGLPPSVKTYTRGKGGKPMWRLGDLRRKEVVNIRDGSGLSRHNLLSPSFICSFLQAMTSSPEFSRFVSSLPAPGSGGTLHGVMPEYDKGITSKIRLKSGSMSGVKCFSGYIFPEDGGEPAVFSIMINNSLLSQYRLQKITDRLIMLVTASFFESF